MAKSKRDEIADEKGDGYEFRLPDFDEKAFVRREVLSARASFVALGLGALAGVIAALLWFLPIPWTVGWLPLLGAVLLLRPALTWLDYPDDITSVRATFGSMFMTFFTGLSVWILGINLV